MGEKSDHIPEPAVMPVDREVWARQLNLSNFINTYCQYRDLQSCGNVTKVLLIGTGQGFEALVLKWRGYEVTTFDIDELFHPDVVGSVHDLSVFKDKSFDVVIASHVLEHLAEPYLERSLKEIARVGNYALIYLPVAGKHGQLRLIAGVRGIDLSFIWDIYNFFEKPDGNTPRYCQRQHFWEIGMRGFRVRDIQKRMEQNFHLIHSYRNKYWLPSYNFILKSKIVL
jgi:hypothetical protein